MSTSSSPPPPSTHLTHPRQTLVDAGRWMVDHMWIESAGMFYDCVDARAGEVMKKWSPFHPNVTHPTLNQVARPNNEGYFWLDLYRLTTDKMFLDVFVRVCDTLVATADPLGLWMQFVPNDASSGFVHPRFNLWYAESLFEGYAATGNATYLKTAIRTLETYTRFVHSDGTFYYKNYIEKDGRVRFHRGSICGSGLSFASMLWKRAQRLGYKQFDSILGVARKWLATNRFPVDHPDRNVAGALLETRSRVSWENEIEQTLSMRGLASSFGVRFFADE
jgi:hypothetical protein